MTQKEKIQGEIERTLQSFDGVKKAEANPFLFTRIKARMNKRSTGWEGIFSFVSKPAIAIAIVAIVMAVNGWALWGSNTNEETITESPNASELATEYNSVASVNNYDYENMSSE
jgi:flagellar biosynthesis/type III secretory pathway M-ring protein FliF/YscJ